MRAWQQLCVRVQKRIFFFGFFAHYAEKGTIPMVPSELLDRHNAVVIKVQFCEGCNNFCLLLVGEGSVSAACFSKLSSHKPSAGGAFQNQPFLCCVNATTTRAFNFFFFSLQTYLCKSSTIIRPLREILRKTSAVSLMNASSDQPCSSCTLGCEKQ